MPGMARSSSSPRYASLSVACAIVSDAFRYARILTGFSLLISRRSAISAKMRAMARFSMSRRGIAEAQNDSMQSEPADPQSRCDSPGFGHLPLAALDLRPLHRRD